MEQCPRCNGELETLSLGEVSTVSCPHCSYAGIPVTHESQPTDEESWHEAFNRFYNQSNAGE